MIFVCRIDLHESIAAVEEHDWSQNMELEGCDAAKKDEDFDDVLDLMIQEALSLDVEDALSMEQIEDEFCESLEKAFQEEEAERRKHDSLVVGQAEANHVGLLMTMMFFLCGTMKL